MTEEKMIRRYLEPWADSVSISVVSETGSTNDDMKKRALEGEAEISLLMADSQTGGKGRKGRSFFSPEKTGIYMSFLLRPDYSAEDCTLLTTMAAEAVAAAIEGVTGQQTGIKWVNDVFIRGRKVAGILTEGAFSKDLKKMEWAIIGIGINLAEPSQGFPEDIESTAGALLKQYDEEVKCRLIAEITNRIIKSYRKLDKKEFLEAYRKRLFFLGGEITVMAPLEPYRATAVDIDDMCHLIVRTEEGEERIVSSGEISIKI